MAVTPTDIFNILWLNRAEMVSVNMKDEAHTVFVVRKAVSSDMVAWRDAILETIRGFKDITVSYMHGTDNILQEYEGGYLSQHTFSFKFEVIWK